MLWCFDHATFMAVQMKMFIDNQHILQVNEGKQL